MSNWLMLAGVLCFLVATLLNIWKEYSNAAS